MRSPATVFEALHDGWTVEAVDGPVPENVRDRVVAATVPGCVHLDLLRVGLIEAPFDGDNEAAQQWIGSTSWRYRTEFDWTDDGAARHDLVAAGLDTVATIVLNGVIVAQTENQHRSYRFDLQGLLREGRNELAIEFAAPVEEIERRQREHGTWPHVNHHPFNLLRKTASNFGWDWGIDAATSGIWRPIGLESWSGVRLRSVRPLVDVDGTTGVLTAHLELERAGGARTAEQVTVTVAGRTETATVDSGSDTATVVVRVPDADLWWPSGRGTQALHDVRVEVADAVWVGRVGFRTVTLDTAADEHGNRFELRVNGEAVAVRGVNWIPDHAFLTEVDVGRIEHRLQDAVEADVNLIRVWGGGIYESDAFYDRADELGLLVWQDFLFACAAYPEETWLSVEVEAEAREQVARLSPHPSLVLWNGNNENIWAYVEWGWRQALGDRAWGDGYYRRLLPAIVAELDPTRPYSPGSPYSYVDYAHPNDPRNGTMHIWDVWNERDWTAYRDHEPRFVSEFGFQGPPAWSTLVAVVHDDPLDPHGPEMLVHQKADRGNDKLDRGLEGHLPAPSTIEDWHWATQLNQAYAIRFGIEHFRSLAPWNSGVVLWQLNDDWPVVSWAAVDFAGHRKPLWYALRAAYALRLATLQPRADAPSGTALVLVNDTAESVEATAVLTRIDFSGRVLARAEAPVEVPARGTRTVPVPGTVVDFGARDHELVVAEVPGFARALLHPAEPVDQRLDGGALAVEARRDGQDVVILLTAEELVRDVFVHADRVDPTASGDHGLRTLLAGERVELRFRTAADPAGFLDPLVVRSANDLVAAGAVLR